MHPLRDSVQPNVDHKATGPIEGCGGLSKVIPRHKHRYSATTFDHVPKTPRPPPSPTQTPVSTRGTHWAHGIHGKHTRDTQLGTHCVHTHGTRKIRARNAKPPPKTPGQGTRHRTSQSPAQPKVHNQMSPDFSLQTTRLFVANKRKTPQPQGLRGSTSGDGGN